MKLRYMKLRFCRLDRYRVILNRIPNSSSPALCGRSNFLFMQKWVTRIALFRATG